MINDLTYREYGILMHIYLSGIQATEPSLRTPHSEGRDALRAALKRLETLGYISRKKTAVGACYGYEARLTDKAVDALKTRLPMGLEIRPLLQPSELNSPYSNTSLTSKEYTGTESREEEIEVINMSGWGGLFDVTPSDENLETRIAAQKFRKQEYEEAKQQRQTKKMVTRHNIDPKLWTCSDIGYEFADRIQKVWSIKPWSVRQSRFVPALSEFRKKHDTNGEIELNLLDMFFAAVDLNKYDNADILWRMFIKRAPEFLTQAKGMVRSEEQVEVAKAKAKKSQEWLYD